MNKLTMVFWFHNLTLLMLVSSLVCASNRQLYSANLSAGVAKVDITDRGAGPVNDPLYVKALVLRSETTTVAIVTVDAVAIGEIGKIKNYFLAAVRSRLSWPTLPTSARMLAASATFGHLFSVRC